MTPKKIIYSIAGLFILWMLIDTLTKSEKMAESYVKIKNLEKILPLFKKGSNLYCGKFSNYEQTLISITTVSNEDWKLIESDDYFKETMFFNKKTKVSVPAYTCSDRNKFEDIEALLDKEERY